MAGLVTGNKVSSAAVRGPQFYASDYAVLPPLICAEGRRLPKRLWEPSCGNGALVLPLRRLGYVVTATDLVDWGCPDGTGGVDFHSPIADLYRPVGDDIGILTNPPFGAVEEYIERAIGLAPYVALLLRLAFLESEGRMRWFSRVGLRRVHIIAERLPMMHRHDFDGPKLDKSGLCFAWFIFEPDKRPARQVPVRWISWKESARRYPQASSDTPPTAREQLGLFAGVT